MQGKVFSISHLLLKKNTFIEKELLIILMAVEIIENIFMFY